MTDIVNVEQCDREARNRLMKLIDCMGGEEDCWQIDQALARHRIAERERCEGIAEDFGASPGTMGPALVTRRAIAQAIREPKP